MGRFSLLALFLVVTFIAISSAALANATDLCRQAAVTVTVGILLAATLLARTYTGERRLLADGFATFGWIYFLLALVPNTNLRSHLLTDRSIDFLYTAVYETDQPKIRFTDGMYTYDRFTKEWSASIEYEDFADIGHSLWTIMVACMGAVLARFMLTRRVKKFIRGESSLTIRF